MKPYSVVILVALSSAALYRVATLAPSPADPRRLPIGDGHLSTAPRTGYVWSCESRFGGGGAFTSGAWIHADGTYDITAKPAVTGVVKWPSEFRISTENEQRIVTGNDLPNHATGTFPISPNDEAFKYDRNPNSITAQTIRVSMPLIPSPAAQPSCAPMGPVGVLVSGAYLFNALDGRGEDAVAHEIQDACQGHPEPQGAYHYHNLTSCIDDTGPSNAHSALMGYAFDGFGVYGHRGEGGHELTNADLDECHGHTHTIVWEGQQRVMYHYHATMEYPYTIGCFRGTPAVVGRGRRGPPPFGRGRGGDAR